MRNNKIVPGVFLISLGIVFLLQSYGFIDIQWWNIYQLWPIFIVIAGINLIFANNRAGWATALKVGVIILGMALLVFGKFDNDRPNWGSWGRFHHYNKNDTAINVYKIHGNSAFSEPYHADAHIAKLNISGGGTSYNLGDTTNQLFQAYTKDMNGSYEFSHSSTDSIYTLDFNMKNNAHVFWGGSHSNIVVFKLNSMPIWDMDIQTGATKLNFDLSKFKIRNIDLNGGAASYYIKMGEPLEVTKIVISTGAAKVFISVPKDAACKIDTDSGLTSNSFEGFNKTDDDSYETPGFATAKKQIFIKFDGGVSNFRVTRY